MELIAAAVDDIEAVLERGDVDGIDTGKLRNLLKGVSASKLDVGEATSLRNVGLRVWNVSVQIAQKHSTAMLANVKVCNSISLI